MYSGEPWAVAAFVIVYLLLGMLLPHGLGFFAQMVWLFITGVLGVLLFSGKRKLMPAAWGTVGLIFLAVGAWDVLQSK